MSDETTLNTTVDNNLGQEIITDKQPGPVPYARFQEVVHSKNELETKLAEKDAEVQRVKLETEMNYAKQIYGESVEDASVQEYKTKYPDLTYPQIFGALGIEVPTVHSGVHTPSRPIGSMSLITEGETFTVTQLGDLQAKEPSRYKEVMGMIASGKAKAIPG